MSNPRNLPTIAGAAPPSNLPRLTLQQETFVLEFLRTGSASEAYRRAYKVGDTVKPESVWAMASRLLNHVKVKSWIEHLRSQARSDNLNSILLEFDQNRNGAIDDRNWSAANGATRGKAQVLGLIPRDREAGLQSGVTINILIVAEDEAVF